MRQRILRVGVDVSVLAKPHTGIARYLANMLAEMLPRADRLDFHLYSAQPVSVEFDGNWRLRVQHGVRGAVGGYWAQEVCPHWLNEDRIDVFWGQNYVLPLRLRRPCRRVMTLHDITGLLMPWTVPLSRRLHFRLYQRRAAAACDCLAVDSEATARLARLCLGVPQAKLRTVLPGCDSGFSVGESEMAVMAGTVEARVFVRERFGVDAGYMLAVSTLEPRKGFPTLFNAVRALPDVPVLLVAGGLGWRCGRILDDLKTLQADGRARYLGRVDDGELAALYRAAGLYVNPSLYEGFGLPVVEAMVCGCPVVCSWTSSLPEVGGDAARYFRPGDSAHLVQVLGRVLGNPAELEAMRAAGLRRAALFSFERAAGEMLEILREQGSRVVGVPHRPVLRSSVSG